ncbi:MAG: prephenate dehydratase domain-containing protein, partial [Nannocystaceae bacterium]
LFDALEQGGVDRIIVPVENSTSGAIVEVNELLASREIVVVDEEIYPVQHCLAGVPGARMAAITTVRSHPVALRQCERALGSLAGVRLEHADNTGRAAQSVGQNGDRSIAAICSPEAAAAYGLEILREDAADQVHNQTRFLLISKTPEPFDARQDAKTSLILSLDHRRGSLANCLQLFAQHNINLTRLESRPQPEQPWEYLFFVDFEGNPTEPNIHAALDAVRGHCNHMQTLGTYPLRAVERERVPAAATRLNPPALTTQPRGSGVVHVNGIDIGGGRFVIVASIPGDESSGTMLSLAEASLGRGASILHSHTKCPPDLTRRTTSARGPAVAPCEPITLAALADAGRQFEVPVSTFVTRPDEVGRIASSVDLLFVASDDLQDLSLLRALGRARRPVILTRSPLATIDTLLTAADYVCSEGNNQVLLCESGLRRTGGLTTRPTLDVSAIPRLKSETRYPVLVDPTRFSDDLETVIPLAIAAAAAGADGFVFPVLTAEVDRLSQLTHRLDATLSALGREL